MINNIVSTMLVLPLILVATASPADEQLLSESAVGGRDADGLSAVVTPDLANQDPDVSYTTWVAPNAALDIRAVVFSQRLLILDGNVIREVNSSGEEVLSSAFPVDCTKLRFMIPKRRGEQEEFLKACTAIIATNSAWLRIFGQSKGNSYVSIAYNPDDSGCPAIDPDPIEDRICAAVRQADGTPPQITDGVNDESDAAIELRGGPSNWALGERKKIIRFPIAADPSMRDQEPPEVKATLNGLKLDGIAPYGANQVMVADDDGRLLAVNTANGSFEVFYSDTVCEDPELGRKTPQKFSVRADTDGDFVYLGNRACGTVTVLTEDMDGNAVVVDTDDDSMDAFLFDNDSDGVAGVPDGSADFQPESLTLRTGQSGDFEECTGGDVSLACQLGQEENQARQFATRLLGGPDSSFRGFQFVLNDCRWSLDSPGGLPCPIVNCISWSGDICDDPAQKDQVIDVMELALRADGSGEFRQLLDAPDSPPVITVPGYLRADNLAPPDPDSADNDWTFWWFFIFSEAVFEDVFKTQYNIDILRGAGSDPCDKLPPHSPIVDVSERANVIAYTPSTYNTIDRPGQDVGDDHKGATVINSFCNRSGGTSYRWSGQVVGLEFTETELDTFIDFTALQMSELQRAKDELLCNPNYTYPDGSVGPQFLSDFDCDNLIQPELTQMSLKLETCHNSAREIQGNSAENCNALFTKIAKLQDILDLEVVWPTPVDPFNLTAAEIRLLRPNFEGEFRARFASFQFALTDWFLTSIPEEGTGP
jgi:hypothetical protein